MHYFTIIITKFIQFVKIEGYTRICVRDWLIAWAYQTLHRGVHREKLTKNFVFDENGNTHEHQRLFTLAEGAGNQDSVEEYWKGYREQVRFVNAEIKKVIEDILLKSETPPIILVMGDHGPASMFNWKIEDPVCLWERTGNLYAILLPEHQKDGTVYDSITPVNTFRILFNTYFATDLPLLEDLSYMMSWQELTLNVDITERRDSLAGCTISEDAMGMK